MEPRPELTEKSKPVFKEIAALLGDHPIVYRIGLRRALGLARYGQELHTFNGRNAFTDAKEELLDLIQYSVQAFMECYPDKELAEFRGYLDNLIKIHGLLDKMEMANSFQNMFDNIEKAEGDQDAEV